jgi:hypothetical protein
MILLNQRVCQPHIGYDCESKSVKSDGVEYDPDG